MRLQRPARADSTAADRDWRRRKRQNWGDFGSAQSYEQRIGRYALGVDQEMVAALLDGAGRTVLDLPCGAGRMSHQLMAAQPRTLVSADYSSGMIEVAHRRLNNPVTRCDAFALPFRDRCFERILTLRLVFHYSDPRPILREAARTLGPGGELVFDTLNAFSTRHLTEWLLRIFDRRRVAAGLSFARPAEVERMLAATGFEVLRCEARYLLPTRIYRYLPRLVCRILASLERLFPSSLRVLTYWRVVKRP